MKKFIIPLRLVEDDSDYSPQEKLVIEQRYYGLSKMDEANDALDNKALSLLQASGFILTLVSALRLPGLMTTPSLWVWLPVSVGFLTFLVMVGLSLAAWFPRTSGTPGRFDFDEIYDKYVVADRDNCFHQVIADFLGAYEILLDANKRKTSTLRWAVILFGVQTAALFAALVAY